jgi:uncharacterized membrane protein
MKPNKLINNLYLRIFAALAIIIAFVAVFTSGKQFVEEHSLALLIAFIAVIATLDLRIWK